MEAEDENLLLGGLRNDFGGDAYDPCNQGMGGIANEAKEQIEQESDYDWSDLEQEINENFDQAELEARNRPKNFEFEKRAQEDLDFPDETGWRLLKCRVAAKIS